MPRQRAVHGARVHINKTQRLGHQLGVGALAAGARAVNRNDYRMFQNVYVAGFRLKVASGTRVGSVLILSQPYRFF